MVLHCYISYKVFAHADIFHIFRVFVVRLFPPSANLVFAPWLCKAAVAGCLIRVQGLEFRGQSCNFHGLGFGVLGLRFRVQG